MDGGDGSDLLVGHAGLDSLIGGAGRDQFVSDIVGTTAAASQILGTGNSRLPSGSRLSSIACSSRRLDPPARGRPARSDRRDRITWDQFAESLGIGRTEQGKLVRPIRESDLASLGVFDDLSGQLLAASDLSPLQYTINLQTLNLSKNPGLDGLAALLPQIDTLTGAARHGPVAALGH